MNSKKKNKNKQNKPPNPVPPQKSETVSENLDEKLIKPDEKEPVQPQIDISVIERLPEIKKPIEIIPLAAIEKSHEADTPKKPKRNRGKKKKQDEDEFEDYKEHETSGKQSDPVECPKEILESKEKEEEKVLIPKGNAENIAPTARKKKNKNKNTEQSHEEKATTVDIKADSDITISTNPFIEDIMGEKPFEIIESKKKNKKKKNRTDSEKSEKSEDLFTCTSAFQKLIDTKEEMGKDDLKTEIPITDDSSISEATVKVDISKTETISVGLSEVVDANLPGVPTTDVHKDSSGKNKKKNKKDKKNSSFDTEQSKPIILDLPSDEFVINKGDPPPNLKIINVNVLEQLDTSNEPKNLILEDSITSREKSPKPQHKVEPKRTEKKSKGKSKNEEKIIENVEPLVEQSSLFPIQGSVIQEKEKSPKPQPKIAKPVEKKKNKESNKLVEPVLDIKERIKTEDLSSDTLNKRTEIDFSCQESKNDPVKVEQKELLEVKEIDQKNIGDNKKQKQPDEIICETEIISESCSIKNSSDSEDIEITPILDFEEMLLEKSLEGEVKEEKEKVEQSIFLPVESKNKKRKKSPKPQKHEPIATELTEKIPESIKLDEPSLAEPILKAEISAAEISPSVLKNKAEEIIIPIETTPDVVERPRSNSEIPDDNNNNMVIQEILSVDEGKIQITPETLNVPIIQRSGETPLSSPEIVQQASIQLTEVLAEKPKEQEKTDLKSKVMEVNQDMEELRKSIERSLAELTAIETSEKKDEGRFAEKEQEKQVSTPTMEIPLPSDLLAKVHESEFIKPKIEDQIDIEKQMIEQPIIKETISLPEVTPVCDQSEAPICPARKDNKGKGKSKKKGKQEVQQTTTTTAVNIGTATETKTDTEEKKTEDKTEKKCETQQQEKGKQQASSVNEASESKPTEESFFSEITHNEFEPIESFDDALTSSVEDVNKTFEIIANEANDAIEKSQPNPEINITAPADDNEDEKKREKTNPVSQPKNLLGHPDIPVPSNKTDYKKEKDKTPNTRQAKVKIKDAVLIESKKQSTETQTDNKLKNQNHSAVNETITSVMNDNEEYIYKYSFRKVYLPSSCHVCTKDLKNVRVACGYCNLLFYCSVKHKDENWPQHQAFCFAVSTITHLKNQKFIYADAKNVTGHNYRLLRMQMIISCEKVLKRKLAPWEQEVLLYPRICSDSACREWRQSKLSDCDQCGQTAFCTEYPEHLPKIHQRWCKSYSLYQKLVTHQQTKGRLETKMPGRVMKQSYQIPDKINMVLATLYEEKIDMNDMQYAALTQLATAPLTAAYCHQLFTNKMNAFNANGVSKKSALTVHVVGAELQFEADVLNKWEVFLAHVKPEVTTLDLVLIAPDLNPSNLPLDLLGKISLCNDCKENQRKVKFSFQDKKTYHEYWSSNDFTTPDLVCAFNPSIHRSAAHNGNDPWPSSINSILKQKVPFIISSYTITELNKDLARIRECAKVEFNMVSEPKFNNFASVRPDRNFISDDEMPLLFKNYCYMVIVGAL